ncbi:MAG TPA: Ig-like domain-containing protein, partial [Thermoanaerobaculia bacterium]
MARKIAAAILFSLALFPAARASEFASGQLNIAGVTLEVDTHPHQTGADIPGVIPTLFGGKSGDAAPPTTMVAAADLIGPGIDAPITIRTQPGRPFTLPPLHQQGTYTLLNIRLLDDKGNFVQPAVPASTTIDVVGTLSTDVQVKQLTPDDLRARGINVDATNYDAYDYNFLFAVQGVTVQVPYTVLVDKRTHQTIIPPGPTSDGLPPPPINGARPRWDPPQLFGVMLLEDLSLPPGDGDNAAAPDTDEVLKHRRPTIPAAVVIPTGFGVLHQFFAVILNVSNAAPAGSEIKLDSVTATFTAPNGMRISKVTPAVAIGQPVPIYDKATGNVILLAQAQGSAEWTLESLRTGTQSVDIDIRAIYSAPDQPQVPLKGHLTASIVVNDPRFQVNFVHPDNVRAAEPYTAYAFITNVSASKQTVKVDLGSIPLCSEGTNNNICRVDGDAVRDFTIDPGGTVTVPYHLKSTINGHFYAAVPDAPDGVAATVTLRMGVDANGIPLSPATIVMPWYTQYVNSDFVNSQMPLIGIAYSLATAPMVPALSSFPRLIRTDVFTRAQDIARAGQRIFVARANASADNVAEDRDPIFHLALDLLGNVERAGSSADMHEWDQVREKISNGRIAEAGMARELERVGLANGKSMSDFAADFAAATSHRSPYFLALAHGAPVSGSARPYALSVTGATSGASISGRAEDDPAPATLPFAQLTRFGSPSESGELALVGRWNESMKVTVVPQVSAFTLDLVYPGATDGSFLRHSLSITGATAGSPVTVTVDRGNGNLVVSGAVGTPASGGGPVAQTPLAVVHAAQDLHLDDKGHIVTVLFNRPVKVDDAGKLRDLVTLVTSLPAAGVPEITKKNNPSDPNAQVVIPGAALQDDGRLLNVSFDHALTAKAQYKIGLDPIADGLTAGMSYASAPPSIVPRIDNNAPGGSIVGKLLLGDNTPVKGTLVQLTDTGKQFDVTQNDGSFLFEFIGRDIDKNISGGYTLAAAVDGKDTRLSGAIHTDGEVQRIVLQFLGRGSVTGVAKYSDGTPLPAKKLVAAKNSIFGEYRSALTNADGSFRIDDLPVGPFSLAVLDGLGNASYATNQIRTPNEVVVQDLVVQKQPFAGTATIKVTVKRSDFAQDPDPRKALVAGAHVGVSTAGVGLLDGFTDVNGQITFQKVPTGFVSLFAAEFNITRSQAADDFPLTADTTVEKILILDVPTASTAICTLEGNVTRDDPANPASPARYPVPNAVVHIADYTTVTADATGHYVFHDLPTSLAGKKVSAYDAETRRAALTNVPTLTPNVSNLLPIEITSTKAVGRARLILHLYSATGQPVPDYYVNLPGYPPTEFQSNHDGTYTLDVLVPRKVDVWALPGRPTAFRHHLYGYQTAHISMNAQVDGQDVHAELHLPGQGTVGGRILQLKRCPDGVATCPPEYDVAHGKVGVSHLIWFESDQALVMQERIPVETDDNTGYATTDAVPVGGAEVVTVDHPAGFAAEHTAVQFEGHPAKVDLKIEKLGNVTGRVFNWDGQTPIAGADLTLFGSFVTMPNFKSGVDGTFSFPSVAADMGFRIVAKITLNGIERWGYVDGHTPKGGGPVGPLNIIMRRQANIGGTIVDANGAPVPLARYWIRELGWPYRTFGSQFDPLYADKNGAFFVNNVFTGGVRISAEDPIVQEDRGDASAEIRDEGDDQNNIVVHLGSIGRSLIRVTVLDPNNAYAVVPNAEVTLMTSSKAFDFASTDAHGVAELDEVPVDRTYSIIARSKSLGRGGSVGGITLTAGVPKDVQIALTMTGIVAGTVVQSATNNAPVIGAAVNLIGPADEWASTDDTGAFIFNGVPEGTFRLDGVDLQTGRHTVPMQNPLSITPLFPEQRNIVLPLEATATLVVNVWLPDDAGHSSGIFVPQANVTLMPTGESHRDMQVVGGPITFTNVIAKKYSLHITEIGGLQRNIDYTGNFTPGQATQTLDFVLTAYGEVDVHVTGEPSQIAGASVVVVHNRQVQKVYTDGSGNAKVPGVELGTFTASVISPTLGLSAATNGELTSQSQPASVTLALGQFVTLDGYVDAELGGPSVNTKVTASFFSANKTFTLEARTDASGYFQIVGIPPNIQLRPINFYAADGTLGAHIDPYNIGTAAAHLGHTHLDSTAPRVLSTDPANNANAVAPNAHIRIAFSEPLNLSSVGGITLTSVADAQNAQLIFPSQWPSNNVLDIAPASILKSNTVYHLFIPNGVSDLSGNIMTGHVDASFTTVDYTEPKIVFMTPAVTDPVFPGQVFKAKFNKAVDVHSFDAGHGATATLQELDRYKGDPVAGGDVPLAITADAADPATFNLAPQGVAIKAGAFYRLTIGGVGDTQTPPVLMKAPQSFDYFGYDQVKPAISIVSPVPAGTPLVSGGGYMPTIASADKDIKFVEWYSTDGTNKTLIAKLYTAPYGLPNFTAPVVTAPSTVTLYAKATDLSLNDSDFATFTWDVLPNLPPQNITVTLSKQTIYLKNHVDATVAFSDEGVSDTVRLAVIGKHADGSDYPLTTGINPAGSITVSRPAGGAWPTATFGVDLPGDLKEGDSLRFVATVTDVDSKSGTGEADTTVAVDSGAPSVVSLLPQPDTPYAYGNGNTKYTIQAKVRDAESGAQKVVFNYDGQSIPVTASTYDAATATWTFSTQATVTPKNTDTRIRITATAYDYHGNATPASTEVIYQAVNDASIPKAQWITPIDGAALPANKTGETTTVKLRVHATDDVKVESVTFTSAQFTSPVDPVTVPKSGTADIFEATATLTVPAEGTPFTITATVKDSSSAHDVVLPIAIDPVNVDAANGDVTILGPSSIEPGAAAGYAGKNVVVTGAGAVLYIKAPVTLKNLIVINGATVGDPSGTKLDVTVAQHLYVDGDSAVNVSGKGYLGGWHFTEDGGTQNTSAIGKTKGDTITGGAANASASYGGFGGYNGSTGGTTNAAYGSITAPTDFGSGGSGSASGQVAGGNGGGAAALR